MRDAANDWGTTPNYVSVVRNRTLGSTLALADNMTRRMSLTAILADDSLALADEALTDTLALHDMASSSAFACADGAVATITGIVAITVLRSLQIPVPLANNVYDSRMPNGWRVPLQLVAISGVYDSRFPSGYGSGTLYGTDSAELDDGALTTITGVTALGISLHIGHGPDGVIDSRYWDGSPSNTSPQWRDPITSLTFTQGVGGTQDYSGFAYDPDGDTLAYSLFGTSYSGIYIDPVSGLLTISNSAAAAVRVLTLRITDDGGLSADAVVTVTIQAATSATFIIAAGTSSLTFDGSIAQPKVGGGTKIPAPGDIIELAAGTHGPRTLRNLQGTSSLRIAVRSASGGQAIIRRISGATGGFVWLIQNCRYVTFDGSNTGGVTYGIKVMYATSGADGASAYIMIGDNLTAQNAGNPTSFVTMRNVEIDGGWLNASATDGIGVHLNEHTYFRYSTYPTKRHASFLFERMYVHHCEGEGFYLGPNYDDGDIPLEDIQVSNCIVTDTGWDGIQLKSCYDGSNSVHHCTVQRAGRRGDATTGQHYGISVSGTSSIHSNKVLDTGEHSIDVYIYEGPLESEGFGPFPVSIYNNVCVRAGTYYAAGQLTAHGIVAGSGPTSTVEGIVLAAYNNTIVGPDGNGVNTNSNTGSGFVRNNLCISCGAAATSLAGGITGTNNPTSASFVNAGADDYHLTAAVAATGTYGTDIALTDYDGLTRTSPYDCGAFEYVAATVATYNIPSNGASNTRRTYDGSLSSGMNGAPWTTSSGVVRVPRPGDIIQLAAGTHGVTRFKYLYGESGNEIRIRGPSIGVATIRRLSPADGEFVFDFDHCSHIVIDGYSASSGERNCGIKVTYALNATMGTGNSPTGGATLGNKDGPAYFVKYNALVSNVTIQYVHVDGGWIYSASSTNYGSGYSYAGGSVQMHNNGDLPGVGLWRENFKFLHLYIQRTRGTLYLGPNYDDNGATGVRPCRNVEAAYNWIEYTGSGGSEGKCWFEGDNSYHHNVVIGCGTANPTNFHGGLLILSGTGKVYNNWIEDIGGDMAVWNYGGYPHGTQNYVLDGPVAAQLPWNIYGPYAVFDYEVYNNVIINSGVPGIVDGSGVNVGRSDALLTNCRAKVYNNTVVGSSQRGVLIENCVTGSFIKNNVLIENAEGPTSNASATVSDNTTTGTAATVFVDAANDNYHLATLTPSASGTEGVDIAATDYDDVTRPQGAAYERGAYED